MFTLTLTEAKAKLSEVLDRVEAGEEIVVTRLGKPVARITSYKASGSRRRLGFMNGQGWMAEDFDEWPEEESNLLGLVD